MREKRLKPRIGGRRGFRRRGFSSFFTLTSYFLNRRVLSDIVSDIVSARFIDWRLPTVGFFSIETLALQRTKSHSKFVD